MTSFQLRAPDMNPVVTQWVYFKILTKKGSGVGATMEVKCMDSLYGKMDGMVEETYCQAEAITSPCHALSDIVQSSVSYKECDTQEIEHLALYSLLVQSNYEKIKELYIFNNKVSEQYKYLVYWIRDWKSKVSEEVSESVFILL